MGNLEGLSNPPGPYFVSRRTRQLLVDPSSILQAIVHPRSGPLLKLTSQVCPNHYWLPHSGAHSGSGPSKQLLSDPGSNEDVEWQLIPKRELIPKEADGWPFCLHPIEQVPMTVENKMPKYSLAEVRRATRDFAEDGLLGEGRYGGVFHGELLAPLLSLGIFLGRFFRPLLRGSSGRGSAGGCFEVSQLTPLVGDQVKEKVSTPLPPFCGILGGGALWPSCPLF